MCPTSNLQTGAAASIADHPIGLLRRLQFRVTVNTDNRLMSATSTTGEFAKLVAAFGYGIDDLPACDLFTASFPCNDLSIAHPKGCPLYHWVHL